MPKRSMSNNIGSNISLNRGIDISPLSKVIDKKDKKILLELEDNARQSNKQIAKKVGVNFDLVRYRINKLEEKNIIVWFLTIINFSKLGYTDYGIYLTTRNLTREKEKEFINYFMKHKRVSYFAKLGGKYDFVLGLLALDILDLQSILSEILEVYGDYILNKDIAIRIHLFYFSKSYLLDKKSKKAKMPHFGGRVELEEIDRLDQKILSILATNSRINIVEISRLVKTPSSTISSRIKKLEKRGIINGFITFTRCQSYGYQNFLIHISLKNLTKNNENKLYAFCNQNPNIVYMIKTIGKWDYEISVEVQNQEKFQEVFTELRENFSDILINMESVIIFKDLKYNLYPF